MLGGENVKLPQLSKNSNHKKKKKKSTTSTNTPESADHRRVPSLLPTWCLSLPQGLPPSLETNGRKSKKLHRKSRGRRPTGPQESGDESDGVEGFERELSVEAKESLRWVGALQNPQAEARRLEEYRAKRRLRYVAHREAAFKQAPQHLKTNFK